MVSFTFLTAILASASLITASPYAAGQPKPKPRGGACQKVDVFFTGLPPNHPLVTKQGRDPKQVEQALKDDAAAIRKAGYNLKVVLAGPEQPLKNVREEMRHRKWEYMVIGYGLRGSDSMDSTKYFTKLNSLFHKKTKAKTLFNFSPNSTSWALETFAPMAGPCADKPGLDLGFKVLCDGCAGGNQTKAW